MNSTENKILWSPEHSGHTRTSKIEQYIKDVNNRYQIQLADARDLYHWSVAEPEKFWRSYVESSQIIFRSKSGVVLENQHAMPGARWFPEYTLNFAENLLAPALTTPAKTALIFRSEDKISRNISYRELQTATAALTAHFTLHNLTAGDRVAAITPNCPEAIIGMLATSSIGAIWSSCSPDFGVNGIVDRFSQIEPKILLVADGYYYKGKYISILPKVQELLAALPGVKEIIIFSIDPTQRTKPDFTATHWNSIQTKHAGAELLFTELPFNHPLYILFSSGTTGKPKCIVHGAGGTLLEHSKELKLHTDLHDTDVFFYATTCGWMMWNWLVSGLHCGATLVLYDGFPLLHDGRVLWQLAEEVGITVFGTSAGYLSAIQKAGRRPGKEYDLSKLRAVLSTGSVLAPESFDYVYEAISSDLLLASVSGGTDIVGCFALGCPALPVRRGELQTRSFGYAVEVFNDNGESITGEKGELVCTAPFPSMPVCFWNDPDNTRYTETYFSTYPGVWRHGDYVALTQEGGMIFYGRSDAVLNPGGVRIGTAEIYRQVEKFPEIMSAVVVGRTCNADEEVVLFIKCAAGFTCDENLIKRIKDTIKTEASPRHVPRYVFAVPDIPVTRSGKISEISVKRLIHGQSIENREAIANPESLAYFTPKLFLDVT